MIYSFDAFAFGLMCGVAAVLGAILLVARR